jgi:hypothetical protein
MNSFCANFFAQKNYTAKLKLQKKTEQNTLYKKVLHKMLMELTPKIETSLKFAF